MAIVIICDASRLKIITDSSTPGPAGIVSLPKPTWSGTDGTKLKTERGILHAMDFDEIYGYYPKLRGTIEYDEALLYTDLRPIHKEGWEHIRQRHLSAAPAIDAASVQVHLSGIYNLPESLRAHRVAGLEILRDAGRMTKASDGSWENNHAIRLEKISDREVIEEGVDKKTTVLHCCIARYFDQVATNLTLDWESGLLPNGGTTLRRSYEPPIDGDLIDLKSSKLANTFGTAVMFYSKKLDPLLRVRNGDFVTGVPKQALHCTVSGVLELPPESKFQTYGFEFFEYGTHKEINDEFGLTPDQYSLIPIAYARELPRGGKPQLFWIAIAKVDDETLLERAQGAREREEFRDNQGQVFQAIPEDDGNYRDAFTYEGLAAIKLSQEFIESNKKALLDINT